MQVRRRDLRSLGFLFADSFLHNYYVRDRSREQSRNPTHSPWSFLFL